jgi:hypothetical protein
MKKPSKKKSLASSWEGPYLFVRYMDGHRFLQQDEGGRVCVMKGKNENCRTDLDEICNYSTLHLFCED